MDRFVSVQYTDTTSNEVYFFLTRDWWGHSVYVIGAKQKKEQCLPLRFFSFDVLYFSREYSNKSE